MAIKKKSKEAKAKGRFIYRNKSSERSLNIFKNRLFLYSFVLIIIILLVFVSLFVAYYFSVGSSATNSNAINHQNNISEGKGINAKVSLDIEIEQKPKFWSWLKNLFK